MLAVWFFILLGHIALTNPDEGRYVNVARDMLAHHDWIVPILNGIPFLDKPIFYYWVEMMALKIFGLHIWAGRLFSALLAMVGCLMTYYSGRQLFDRITAWLSVIILASSPLYFLLAHHSNMDMGVAVLIANSLMAFMIAQQQKMNKKHRYYWMLCSYGFAGLAFLTKGFIAIVFPTMIIGLWIVLFNQWQLLKKMAISSGIIVILAINLPWFIAIGIKIPSFYHYFFYLEQVHRYLSANFNNHQPVYYYLVVIMIGAMPWLYFLIGQTNVTTAYVNLDKKQPSNSFLIIWIVVITLFFSIPHSKTIGYILPIMPAVALLIGNRLAILKKNNITNDFGYYLATLSLLILGLVAVLLPHYQPLPIKSIAQAMIIQFGYISLSLTTLQIVLLFLLQRRKITVMPYLAMVALNIIIINLAILFILSQVRFKKQLYPLVNQAKKYLKKDTKVIFYYNYYYNIPFYLNQDALLVDNWQKPLAQFADNRFWRMQYGNKLLAPSERKWLISNKTFEQLWHQYPDVMVFSNKKDYQKLAKQLHPSPYLIGEFADTVVFSNDSSTDSN